MSVPCQFKKGKRMHNLIKIYGTVQEFWAFSLKYLDHPKLRLAKSRCHFAYQWLDNVKNKFDQTLIQIYHAVQELWAVWNEAQQTLVHQNKRCSTCQWLDNVDMHLYAKFDQNEACS